jgi:hypothetical protein
MIRLIRELREDDFVSQRVNDRSDGNGSTSGTTGEAPAQSLSIPYLYNNVQDLRNKCSEVLQTIQNVSSIWPPIFDDLASCKGGKDLFLKNCTFIENQWFYLQNLTLLDFGNIQNTHRCDDELGIPLFESLSATRGQICSSCPTCNLPAI